MKHLFPFTVICILLSPVFGFAEEKIIEYDYPEFGVSVLTPAGFNLMAGYSLNDVTIRLTGMHLGKTYGFQTEVNYNYGKSNFFKNGPGIVFGYLDASDTSGSFNYTTNNDGVRGMLLGVHYFWNYQLFYCSLGIAATLINPNTNPPIAMLFNIGINYRALHDEDKK